MFAIYHQPYVGFRNEREDTARQKISLIVEIWEVFKMETEGDVKELGESINEFKNFFLSL